jgi:membrane protein YdbS with pleckstrin-like domain
VTDLPDDALFLDPTVAWQRVSPKLTTQYRIGWVLTLAIGLSLLALGLVLDLTESAPWWPWALAAAPFLATFVAGWFWFAPRTASAWRYAERERDLLVRHGRLNRHLTVVPYGRMQVIEVRSDPLANWLGIATVTLVTASASTDAQIPGLPTDTARDLRDRLAAKGEAAAAGL